MLDGIQSALNAHGPHAAVVVEITTVLFLGAAAIFAAVMGLAAFAIFARRDRARCLGSRALVVGGGVVFPLVALSALLIYSVVRAGDIRDATAGEAALRIEVTAEQWWWRVRYLDASGATDFSTANEIHIPVGRTVVLDLKSADVIHSFWVPALAGKLDVIPGRTNRLRLKASAAGEFRGQCAEYCGGPHAFMAFFVRAQTPERFASWLAQQRAPAQPPGDPVAAKGEQLFAARCATCHSVRGTSAAGELGPDLTHVGTRATLAAGMLPNKADATAQWIRASQKIKPGNLMPSFGDLGDDELRALTAYLEGRT
jgi:cytochrome c oxidase subunit 2